jgi:NADPH-dependent curcumin reductase CurA
LVEYAQVNAGETLLVIGANGGVGSAVAQIGKWKGARVIRADRGPLAKPHLQRALSMISSWTIGHWRSASAN